MFHKIRVNVKSLAAEARIIRQEKIKNKKTEWIVWSLDAHKANILKPEARLANLTYGFLKKYPRSKVESRFKKEVNAVKLFEKVKRFSDYKTVTLEEIQSWLKT